jgi:integrase
MPLTDTAVRAAKPKPNGAFKLSDEKGMYLLVTPTGGKLWRFDYRFNGKRKTLALGVYPDTTLAKARESHQDARKLLAQGIDPSEHKKAAKTAAADTFEALAREWHAKFTPSWAATHGKRVLERLENHIFPYLGNKPIAEVKAPTILAVLRRLEDAGKAESAHRIKGIIGQVMRYAVATGRAEYDPTPSLKGALTPVTKKHRAAVIDPTDIGHVLRILHGYTGTPEVRAALRLGPLLFVRPGELRTMRWEDLDLPNGVWNMPPSKQKKTEGVVIPRIVPLPRQAIELIEALRPLTGHGLYVMPSARSKANIRPMSEGAVLAAYRSLGIPHDVLTGHGWRATARTRLVEGLTGVNGKAVTFPADIVEHQLGHVVRDPNGRAYNRATFFEERRAMMQCWADYLDTLRTGAQILQFKAPASK